MDAFEISGFADNSGLWLSRPALDNNDTARRSIWRVPNAQIKQRPIRAITVSLAFALSYS